MFLAKAYYTFKFIVPRSLQIRLRRHFVRRKLAAHPDIWPIDQNAGNPPEGWQGWPDGKKFALVLTHDIENAEGLDKCVNLADIEERLGFRSSFNFVAGDYTVPVELRRNLTDRGFEIGVHGLHHSGNPFRSESAFRKQSVEINRTLKEWGAVGFRSPSMYHNLEMLHNLDIEYDASTFDTDPFEPQPDGMGTIFPFFVPYNSSSLSPHSSRLVPPYPSPLDPRPSKGYIELPYTLPQDFLLFVLMQEKGIDIWKRKLDWIAEKGGMALFVAHPGYMHFNDTRNLDEYPAKYYEEFLEYIKSKYAGRYWHALPRDIARFCNTSYTTRVSSPVTRHCFNPPPHLHARLFLLRVGQQGHAVRGGAGKARGFGRCHSPGERGDTFL